MAKPGKRAQPSRERKGSGADEVGEVAGVEQGGDVGRREGLGKEEALGMLAAQAPELDDLVGGLDTLGHGLQVQAVAQADDGGREGGVLRAVGDTVDEGLVDLE